MTDITPTLIEAVARAMYERRGEREGQWDNTMKQSHYRDLAQTAIASVIAHATSAINAERLTDDTGAERDIGYTAGLDDAIKAIAALTERQI